MAIEHPPETFHNHLSRTCRNSDVTSRLAAIHIIDRVDLSVRPRHSLTHDGIVATPPLNGLSKCIITDSEFSRSMTMSTSSQRCRTLMLWSKFEFLIIPPCGCVCINQAFRLASRASDGLAGYTRPSTKTESTIASVST